MITVLDLMSITKISPVSVDPLIAAVILLEKDLGGELKLKKKSLASILSQLYLLLS